MRNLLLTLACVAAMSFSSCLSVNIGNNCDGVTPSGNIVTEKRDVAMFNKATFKAANDVVVRQGDILSVAISGDDNILPYVTTTVENGELIVDNKKCDCGPAPKIEITIPEISSVKLLGAGDIEFPEDFRFEDFRLSIIGSGNANVKGSARNFNLSISGSGHINAQNLKSDSVRVSISGSGDVDVYADRMLDARISGAGKIRYYGNVRDVRQSVSGSGSIKRR